MNLTAAQAATIRTQINDLTIPYTDIADEIDNMLAEKYGNGPSDPDDNEAHWERLFAARDRILEGMEK